MPTHSFNTQYIFLVIYNLYAHFNVTFAGIYYCFNIVIVMLSIFLSSLVAHIGGTGKPHKAYKPVPAWIKKVLRVLASLILALGYCMVTRLTYK